PGAKDTLSTPNSFVSYHWSTGSTTTSTVVITGGAYSLDVTDANGCTTSTAIAIGTGQAPTANVTAGGPLNFCAGSSVTLTANSGTGYTYHWSTGASTAAINVTQTGSYIVTVHNVCDSAVSSATSVIVNSIVTPSIAINSSGSIICTGTQVTFSVSGISNGGSSPSYQWKKNGNNVGTNTTSYADNALLNGDIITCVLTSNAVCTSSSTATSNPVIMTVNPILTPALTITTSATTICDGAHVTFNVISTSNGGNGPVYQWKKNGNNVGTNSTSYADNALLNNDVITCVVTSNATCASPVTATSNTITMTVNPILIPSVSIGASATTICAGTLVTFTATPTNGGAAPAYQWKKNGNNVGTSSVTYTDNGLANNDVISCVLTSNATCASPTTATSNTVTMTVNPTLVPAINVGASATTICADTLITFTATPTNGGATPAYQWKKNGNNVGANSATYSDNGLVNNDAITCVLTSNASCASPVTATSNAISITVNPLLVPAISVNASQTTVCAGSVVIFTAPATNGGAAPVYQWKKNNVDVGINSDTYVDSTLANNDVVSCVLTSNALCASPLTATSNNITITLSGTVTPSISITAPGLICQGQPALFTATAVNGGTNPVYQWRKNGNNVGGNSSTYSDNGLGTNDVITCALTSNAGCVAPDTANSNSVTVTVNATVTPSLTIAASDTNICAGTPVTFTATPTDGGITPAYQWLKNGSAVGSNSATYADNTLSSADTIKCILTSNATCATASTATSNFIIVTVNAVVIPAVSIGSTATNICAGTPVTFTATSTNGGATSVYQWKKNGNNVGSNSATYIDSTLNDNDAISCVITSNATCASPTTATSSSITVSVTALVTPSVSISVSPNDTVCAGTLLTFTATANNEGNAPGYQWLVNGLNVTGNGNTYVSGSLLSGDLVSVILAPNAQCVSVINVTSNSIRLTINPIPATPVIVTVGVDSIASSVSGDSYEWLFNDAASGLATQTIGLTQSGSYKVIVTATGCVSDTSAAFNYTFTGLKEINDVIVKLYPNPNQGNFIIDANADIDIIRLYDVTGRIIFEQQQIKASRFIVDIPLVTAGLLNVEIISGGNRWIGKISVVK
ncbi:MAG: hypothetical protein JWO06_489, partial [Bacteroidota bacterium]|nr:hypothetical protein [Bacteroidota bacterium]